MIHRIGEPDASKHRLIYCKLISRLRIGVMFAVNIIRVYIRTLSLSLSLLRSLFLFSFFALKGYLEIKFSISFSNSGTCLKLRLSSLKTMGISAYIENKKRKFKHASNCYLKREVKNSAYAPKNTAVVNNDYQPSM